MSSRLKKFLKNLIGWVLYIAFLIGLVYGLPRGLSYALKTDYPMASITSGSMWPVLKKGDLILVKGVNDKSEIEMGDIVVFENPKGFTIHRVVQLNEQTLVTKGDANNVNDEPVRYEHVIGELLTFNGRPVRIPLLGNVSIMFHKANI